MRSARSPARSCCATGTTSTSTTSLTGRSSSISRAIPEELVDLAGDPAYAPVLERLRKRLLALCDPDEVDARAKRRQAELLARFGGREAALARGDLGFTPAPGTAPEMN